MVLLWELQDNRETMNITYVNHIPFGECDLIVIFEGILTKWVHWTRLVTRTKESNMNASIRVIKLYRLVRD